MNRFLVLDAAENRGRETWLELWSAWPDREIYAHPAYLQLYARPDDRVLGAVMISDRGKVLLPFLLRPLEAEPWGGEFPGRHDWITPYGYGGAFAWGDPEPRRFWDSFREWSRTLKVVSGTARLSLFPDQVLPFDGEVEFKNTNVVRSLDLEAEALWMDYDHKVRKNVNKARRSGLTVETDISDERLPDFQAIYFQTLARRGAPERYYFPEDFFRKLIRRLDGQYRFFYALDGDRPVAAELVLVSARRIYSFLGGTAADAFGRRPNDLLKHAIIEWGMQEKKDAFILGGGYNDRDGIFRYKLSFAPGGEVPFTIGKMICDREAYRELADSRRRWEEENGRDWRPRPDFFPAYRG